jgi:hypothetical protein
MKSHGILWENFIILFYVFIKHLKVEGRIWENESYRSLYERIESSVILFLSFINNKLRISKKNQQKRKCVVLSIGGVANIIEKQMLQTQLSTRTR